MNQKKVLHLARVQQMILQIKVQVTINLPKLKENKDILEKIKMLKRMKLNVLTKTKIKI